jgi:hypothetical protein
MRTLGVAEPSAHTVPRSVDMLSILVLLSHYYFPILRSIFGFCCTFHLPAGLVGVSCPFLPALRVGLRPPLHHDLGPSRT